MGTRRFRSALRSASRQRKLLGRIFLYTRRGKSICFMCIASSAISLMNRTTDESPIYRKHGRITNTSRCIGDLLPIGDNRENCSDIRDMGCVTMERTRSAEMAKSPDTRPGDSAFSERYVRRLTMGEPQREESTMTNVVQKRRARSSHRDSQVKTKKSNRMALDRY